MQIEIVFEKAFQGALGGAVWIVESPENRSWFAQQTALESRSALFRPESCEGSSGAALRCIWNVQEHYPEWARIAVSGVSLTSHLTEALHAEGMTAVSDKGFSLIRNVDGA